MLREHGRGYCNPVVIGKGGFAEVYRVKEVQSGRLLACKVSKASKMSEEEAILLRQIQHELFPAYEEHYRKNGKIYLLMEYISGSNLRSLIERRGSLSQRQAVSIVLELAEGLRYLHEQSAPIIFRDIKPENVMICQNGKAKLVDVGGACVIREDRIHNKAGSKGYAAPEQFEANGRVGVESDVYALGKLLCFMLNGRKISEGLQLLIKQATQSEQNSRIPDMRTFIQKLSAYEKGHFWRRLFFECQTLVHKKPEAEFHYQKNIYRD